MYVIKQNLKPASQQNINNIFATRVADKQNKINELNHERQCQYQANHISMNKQYAWGQGNNQQTQCTIEEGSYDGWGANNRRPLITPILKMDSFQHVSKQKQRVFNCHTRSKSQRQHRQLCVNHANKDAEFRLVIQDQVMFYCVKCAVKLASQGFLVEKLYQLPNYQQPKGRNLRIKPNYRESPNYQHLSQFLNYVTQVEQQHTATMERLSQIDWHYKKQLEHTEYYYEELLAFVQQMRQDHLNDLEQQQRRDSQIAVIEYDYLKDNVEEIDVIWKDVQANLDNIVDKMSEDDLKTNLKFYRYKVQVFAHKVEELQQFFDKLIGFQEEDYHQKLNHIQEQLMAVWNQEPEPKSSSLNHRQTKSEIIVTDLLKNESRFSAPKRQSENLVIKPSQLFKIQNQQTLKFKPQPAQKQKKTTAFRILFTEDEQTLSNSPRFEKA